jgi:pentatricopeptide repeat protein
MSVLYDEIESRTASTTIDRNSGYVLKSLRAQIIAMEGDSTEASQLLEELLNDADLNSRLAQCVVDAHRTFSLALLHRISAENTLDYVVEHLIKVAEVAAARGLKVLHPLARGSPFQDIFLHALKVVNSPSAYLSARLERWTPELAKSIGVFMLRMLCQSGRAVPAYSLLKLLQHDIRIRLKDEVALTVVIALTKSRQYAKANLLYTSLPPTWTKPTLQTLYERTGLMLFSRQGLTERAEAAFSRIGDEYVGDQDLLFIMHAYAVRGDTKRVEELFREFFRLGNGGNDIRKANIRHYSTLLLAYSKRNDLDAINRCISDMIDAGIEPDIVTYNIILQTLAARDDIAAIHTLMDRMRQLGVDPNTKSYTIIISLLAERCDPIGAEAMFRRMIRERNRPDRQIITALMNAHVEAGSWRGVIRMFDYMRKHSSFDMYIDIQVINTLLKAYVLIGAPIEIVLDIYDRIDNSVVQPNGNTFALLIQSACDANRLDIAAQIFRDLEQRAARWESGLEVTVYVLNIIMAAHLRLGDKESAKAVYEDMQSRGIKPTSLVFGRILKAYANERNPESIAIAESFLKTIVDPSDPTEDHVERVWKEPRGGRLSSLDHLYAPLMDAYAKQMSPADVERLYEDMLKADGKPTLASLVLLLDVYRRTGDIEGVMRVWPEIFDLGMSFSEVDPLLEDQDKHSEEFKAQRRTDALCIPLSIYIDAVSSAGRHIEVARVWNQMRSEGFHFDPSNWNHLAVAMVHAGQPERAFEVIEKVILPYQDYCEYEARDQADELDSPLLLDAKKKQTDEANARKTSLHTAKRRPDRRSEASSAFVEVDIKSAREASNANTEDDDFAFELHVLQSSTPTWHLWRPHARTLSVLSDALQRLKSGLLVQPTKPQVTYNDDEYEEVEDERMFGVAPLDVTPTVNEVDEVEDASEILRRIYRKTPRAVRAIEAWDSSERRIGLEK